MKNNRSAAPTAIDWVIEAHRNAGDGPTAIAKDLSISPAAVVARLEKMKRYRKGEGMLAEDPESIQGLKHVGAFPWPAARALDEYYVERLSQLCDWSAGELLGFPGVGIKAVEIIKAAMAARGLELHPERTEVINRRSKYSDWWEQHRLPGHARQRMDELWPAPSPKVSPVIGRERNVVHVDFRRPTQ
jgi:hypothetical protein